ncbi:MAG: YcbK family protein [Vicinamibacterales bacterium]
MLSRRRFLSAVAAVPVLAASRPLHAASLVPRELKFLHTHTGEKLTVEYFNAGTYLPDALDTVNHFLRDFRTGDVHAIDPSLLDLLNRLTTLTESKRPFEVISGYRSPVTNAQLRSHSEGVAAHSLHMVGQAIDIRLTDVPLKNLRAAALSARIGGVGYYPASNFVHVDTGRVRYW